MTSPVLFVGLLAALAASPALAGGLVPGSDHFTEAQADAAANSVASGFPMPIVTSSIVETRSDGTSDGAQTYAREAVRPLETLPGGPAERVASTRPWVRGPFASDPG